MTHIAQHSQYELLRLQPTAYTAMTSNSPSPQPPYKL